MTQLRRSLFILSFLLWFFTSLGCTDRLQNKTSVLVIAVDNLTPQMTLCNSDQSTERKSGIDSLCAQSVNFTHTFTPSLLTQPALTSLLTGEYPFKHLVRDNGANYLASHYSTLAKVAAQKNYATSFFSDGAPVFRKSGLAQGFDLFDDNINASVKMIFRPFFKTKDLFFNWLNDIGDERFFSLIYVNDLKFTDTTTLNDFSEVRNTSFEAQLNEFDEKLFHFFQALKDKNRWDSTYVVLVGLNGQVDSSLNLHTSSTQVALLIKPPKMTDQWNIDNNVSLVDLSCTLFKIFNSSYKCGSDADSLLSALIGPKVELSKNKIIYSESFWGQELDPHLSRVSFHLDRYLYIDKNPPLIFNTFIDKLEQYPRQNLNTDDQAVLDRFKQRIGRINIGVDESSDNGRFLKDIENKFSLDKSDAAFNIKVDELYAKWPEQKIMQDLFVENNIKNQNWKAILDYARKNKKADLETLAKLNMNLFVPRINFRNECLKLFYSSKAKCTDETAITLYNWITNKKREYYKSAFIKAHLQTLIDRKIAVYNLRLNLIWDLKLEKYLEISNADLILNLPQFAKYKSTVLRSIQSYQENNN